jgi:DNA-binding transcriptional ArsR family regulator
MSNYYAQMEPLADQFKALGNPHRLALFQRLMTCCKPGTRCSVDDTGSFCVGTLGEGLNIAPSTLSHHLKELQRCGLVQTERRGKNVWCWIDPGALEQLSDFFQLG